MHDLRRNDYDVTNSVQVSSTAAVTDAVNPPGNVSYLNSFPYLDHPKGGFEVVPPS